MYKSQDDILLSSEALSVQMVVPDMHPELSASSMLEFDTVQHLHRLLTAAGFKIADAGSLHVDAGFDYVFALVPDGQVLVTSDPGDGSIIVKLHIEYVTHEVAEYLRIRTMTASSELPFPPTAIRSITSPAPRRCVGAGAGSCSRRRGGGCPDMINVPSTIEYAKDGEPSSISSAGSTPHRHRHRSTAPTLSDSRSTAPPTDFPQHRTHLE